MLLDYRVSLDYCYGDKVKVQVSNIGWTDLLENMQILQIGPGFLFFIEKSYNIF